MKFDSDCSGDCSDCSIHYWGGCLAGHNDDHFSQITEKEAIRIITHKLIHAHKNNYEMQKVQELVKRFNLKIETL